MCVCIFSGNPNTDTHMHRAAEVRVSVWSVYMFVSACLQFSGAIDQRPGCLKWWSSASEAADVRCHPFVTSASSNPSQQASPLCDCCYACGRLQNWGCALRALLCVCVCVCECTCMWLPWQIYSSPGLPASLPPLVAMAEMKGEGGGLFERLHSFPSLQPPSAPCATAQLTSSSRQTEWIKGDTMRHLM